MNCKRGRTLFILFLMAVRLSSTSWPSLQLGTPPLFFQQQTIVPDANLQPLFHFKLTLSSTNTFVTRVVINAITICSKGSVNESVALLPGSIVLYNDKNKNGVVDGGDIPLGTPQTITQDNGSLFFKGFSLTLSDAAEVWLLVSATLSSQVAAGNTFEFFVNSPTDISLLPGFPFVALQGFPTYGAKCFVVNEQRAPVITSKAPFPNLALPVTGTTVSFSLLSDEPVFNGKSISFKEMKVTKISSNNISLLTNGFTLANASISAGIFTTATPLGSLNSRTTLYNATFPVTESGVLNKWVVCAHAKDAIIKLHVASNAGANRLVSLFTTNLTLGTQNVPFNISDLSLDVEKGWLIGIYGLGNKDPPSSFSLGNSYFLNSDHSGSAVFTYQTDVPLPYLGATGYAKGKYLSGTHDMGSVTSLFVANWEEVLNGGNLSVSVRASPVSANITSAIWVPLTNRSPINNPLLTGVRYLQIRISLVANTNAISKPLIKNFSLFYNAIAGPAVSLSQKRNSDNAISVAPVTFLSGTNPGPFSFQATLTPGYDGVATLSAKGIDKNGNYFSNITGSFTVDNTPVTVSQLSAKLTDNATITNGQTTISPRVTFHVELPSSPPPPSPRIIRYFSSGSYTSAPFAKSTIISTNLTFTTSLFPGLNYTYIRAENYSGGSSATIVFTNTYAQPKLFFQSFSDGFKYIITGAANNTVFHTMVFSGAEGYVINHLAFQIGCAVSPDLLLVPHSFYIFKDEGNGIFDGSETLLAGPGNFSAAVHKIAFDNINIFIPPNTNLSLILCASVQNAPIQTAPIRFSIPSNGVSNHSFDLTLTNIYAGLPLFGQSNLILRPGILNVLRANTLTSSVIVGGENNFPVIDFILTNSGEETLVVSSLSIFGSGSANEKTSVVTRSVFLYEDINKNKLFDSGDVPVSDGHTFSVDNGSVLFDNLTLQLSKKGSRLFFVVQNFTTNLTQGTDIKCGLNFVTASGAYSLNYQTVSPSSFSGPLFPVLGDQSAPLFFPESPFLVPNPSAFVNVTAYFSADEEVYSEVVTITSTTFHLGTGPNLNRTDNALSLAQTRLYLGNSNLSSQKLGKEADMSKTWITPSLTFPTRGIVTEVGGAADKNNSTIEIYIVSNRNGANYLSVGLPPVAINAQVAYSVAVNSSVHLPVFPGQLFAGYFPQANPAGSKSGAFAVFAGKNGATPVTLLSTAAFDNSAQLCLFAKGYTVSEYTSQVLALPAGCSNVYLVNWESDLSAGGNIIMEVRGGFTAVALASAPWVGATKNHRPSLASNTTLFLQYRATLFATPPFGLSTSPVLKSFTYTCKRKTVPKLYVTQGEITNFAVVTSSSAYPKQFVGSFALALTPGKYSLYAAAEDLFGNKNIGQKIGEGVFENREPKVFQLQCYTTPEKNVAIFPNVRNYDGSVSYKWSTNSLFCKIRFYLKHSASAVFAPVTNGLSFTYDPVLDNLLLFEGTNYLHILPISESGVFGAPVTFTNTWFPSGVVAEPLRLGTNLIVPGGTNITMFNFSLWNETTSAITLSQISVHASGSGDHSKDTLSFRLYRDNGNGTVGSEDIFLANGTISESDGIIPFSFAPLTLSPGTKRLFVISGDFSAATPVGKTYCYSLLSSSDVSLQLGSFPFTNTLGVPFSGTTLLSSPLNSIFVSKGSAALPGNVVITSGATDLAMLQFKLSNATIQPATISSLTFTASGTGNDLFNVAAGSMRLYRDANNNGVSDGGDTLLGAKSFDADNGKATFSSLNISLANNSVKEFLIELDLNGTAILGKTFQLFIQTNSVVAINNTTGNKLLVTGAPLKGTLYNILFDVQPPTFYPSVPFSDPIIITPLSSYRFYFSANENVYSKDLVTPSLTIPYPRVTIVQDSSSVFATHLSGTGTGPFVYRANLSSFHEGSAAVYAQGFDGATPPNTTNGLVSFIIVQNPAPIVECTKSVIASNFSTNPLIPKSELLPGSIITFVITYSNKGAIPAHDLKFYEALPPGLYFNAGSVEGADTVEYSDTATFNGYLPISPFDPNVKKIRFTINSCPPGVGGTIKYKLAVR